MIEEITKQVSKWIFILNLPLFLLFVFFPGVIINLIFGPEYLSAENSLRILSIAMFFMSFLLSQNLLNMTGKSKTIAFTMLFSLFSGIVLNYLLIPLPNIFWMDNSTGIIGSALAMTISISLFGVILFVEAYYYTSIIPLRKKMISISFISLIPLSLLFLVRKYLEFTPITVFLFSSLFVMVYFFFLYFFKQFDRNDLMIIKSLFQKGKRFISRQT